MAKAFAPAAVWWVASSGMTGGFSPGRTFEPVVGTSAGTDGRPGVGLVVGGSATALELREVLAA